MAKIFISHSSADRAFAQKLSEDITARGHEPWLDEWEIKVGESITQKIQQGLEDSDYVALVMSKAAMDSSWVEKEWMSKFAEEIREKKVIILPVLMEDCEIPLLLKDKKYADLRRDYKKGFSDLIGGLEPSITISGIEPFGDRTYSNEVLNLIERIGAGTEKVSVILTRCLRLGLELKNKELEMLCKFELLGWKDCPETSVVSSKHRSVKVLCSPFAEINPSYFGFSSPADIKAFMASRSDVFYQFNICLGLPVASLEKYENDENALTCYRLNWVDFIPEIRKDLANKVVFAYFFHADYLAILNSIKLELTRMLLDLLPNASYKQSSGPVTDLRF